MPTGALLASTRSRWDARRRMSGGQRVALTFAFACLLGAAAGVVAHYRAADSLYDLALTAFAPYLELLGVLAAVLFRRVRRPVGWAGFTVAVALVAWAAAIQVPAFVAQTVPERGADIVVMTSNLQVGEADAAAVVRAVREHHVDVLMVQELTAGARARLISAGLDATLPYSVAPTGEGAEGTGMWSRYRLIGTHVSYAFDFLFVTARARFPGSRAPTTLAALHVYGPHPQIQYPGWSRDMAAYPAALRALPGRSVLVGGDFNATPDAAQFRTIVAQGYADAAEQAGAGFTPTWPADRWYPPLITIDHVLTRGAVAQSVDSVEIPGSDHRALVVSVRLG